MNRIIEHIVEEFSKTRLFEMAYSREQYINNIDGIADQIVENWCLIHYCTLYDIDDENKNHWKQELCAHCKKLLRSLAKVNKLKVTQYAMIDMLELDDAKQIEAIIADKFREEHFELVSDICDDFVNIGLHKIIYLVSQNFSNNTYQELYRYIDEDI